MIPRSARNQQTRAKKTPIYLPGRDLPIGFVRDDTFFKTASSARGHFLTTPPAIAFDRCTLRDAQAAGAVRVQVTDRDTGRVYRAPLAEVFAHALPVRRGFGDQVALCLDRWSIDGAPPKAATTYQTNQAAKAAQPTLWEVVTA